MKDGESFVGWFDVKGNEVTARPIPGELMQGNYVEESGNAYTLVIGTVAVTDGGKYTCKGNRSESTFTLFIECKYLLMYYQFATYMFPIMQFVFSQNFAQVLISIPLGTNDLFWEIETKLMQNFVGKTNSIIETYRRSRKYAM